jgi:hypothetical protein
MAVTGASQEDVIRTIRAMHREFVDNVAAKNAAGWRRSMQTTPAF